MLVYTANCFDIPCAHTDVVSQAGPSEEGSYQACAAAVASALLLLAFCWQRGRCQCCTGAVSAAAVCVTAAYRASLSHWAASMSGCPAGAGPVAAVHGSAAVHITAAPPRAASPRSLCPEGAGAARRQASGPQSQLQHGSPHDRRQDQLLSLSLRRPVEAKAGRSPLHQHTSSCNAKLYNLFKSQH